MQGGKAEHKPRQTIIHKLEKEGIRHEHFNNRELSWLEFNARVLEEAHDPSVPLLERIKFLSIFSQNLDEFYMIRVAGLKHQISAGLEEVTNDGMTPQQVLQAVSKRCHELTAMQHKLFCDEILPELDKNGVRVVATKQLDEKQKEYLHGYFRD